MAKDSIRDYSATSSSNSDIQSVDISEGCAPSGLNNAIREVMTDLKNVSTGTVALETPVADSFSTDTISEKTSATGVTIDGVLLKDGAIGSIANAVAAHLTSINGGQIGGSRNLIINGGMTVSQRGATFTSPSAGAYTLDRFKYNENFGAACTITQSTDVPSSDGFLNSMKIDITTAATPASAEEFKIDYGVEGQDFSRAGFGTSGAQTLTLSFWVKSNVTGVYRVNFFNLNGTGNKIVGGTYTINTASTWEKKTIAIPADTSQATYLTNAGGFRIEFYLASGPDRTSGSLPTDWIAYDATRRAAGHAVNLASSTSNEWYITGIQLEVGETATPFEHESYAATLQKCERYFQRFVAGANYTGFSVAFSTSATSAKATLKFNGKMRAAPTITQSNTGFNYGPQVAFSSFNTLYTGLDTSWIDMNIASVGSAGQLGIWNGNNNGAAYVQMSAEL